MSCHAGSPYYWYDLCSGRGQAPSHDQDAFVSLVAQCPTRCVAPLAKEEHVRPSVSHDETLGNSVLSHGEDSFTFEFISIQSSAAKGEDEPGIMPGTAEVPHPIADAHLL